MNTFLKYIVVAALVIITGIAHAYPFGPVSPSSYKIADSAATDTDFVAVGVSGPELCETGGPPTCDYFGLICIPNTQPNTMRAQIRIKLANMTTATYSFWIQNITNVTEDTSARVTNADGSITITSQPWTQHAGSNYGYREVHALVRRGSGQPSVSYTPNTSDVFQLSVNSACSNVY